jgi:hypothetical protein
LTGSCIRQPSARLVTKLFMGFEQFGAELHG